MATDRDELRVILSTEESAIAAKEEAQRNRGKAHDTFEALRLQYQADIQKFSQAEHQADVQLQRISEAKSKLIATAPVAIRTKLERLYIELQESKVDKGVDKMSQLLFKLDNAEQDYARTNSGTDKAAVLNLQVAVKSLMDTQERLRLQIKSAMDEAIQAD